MLVIFEKMALLVIILALGYMCAKLRLVGLEFNKGLSKMVMNVFLAGMILSSVINKDLDMTKGDMLFGIGMLTVMQLICLAVGYITPAAMRIKGGDKGMYRLVTSFSNLGFMGVPVIAAVYGENAIFFASLGNIPFSILLYTVGVMFLQHGSDNKEKINLKSMINVPIIATVIATVIFVFEIPMPLLVEDVASMLSDACIPLSMMCIGLSLGNVSIKDAFIHPRIYGMNFMRLVAAPIAVWFVLHFFITDIVMLGSIVIVAACPPAVVCAILGIDYGRDGVEASETIFVGTVLSMFTIPLLISLLGLNIA
ncbi:MAG: AEC family transporter [Oscillospiraceae bacterium]|nr:AEC family transporter [Oscillospiraceae bacterium]